MLPPLADFLIDEKRTLPSRGLIAKVYGTYAADTPDAYLRLEKQLDEKPAAGASVETKVSLARKQASIGVALTVMGRSDKVWPLLKHSPDPTVRSYLIDRFAPGGVDHNVLIARLEKEQEASIKQAILQSLGEYGLDRLPQSDRRNHIPHLFQLYQEDPHPGIHGAAEWLLNKWQATGEIKNINKALTTGKVEGKRQWYLNSQGDTMVVIPKPGEFWMGAGVFRNRWRIDRNFAIASKEVTVEQYLRFLKEHKYQEYYASTGACPVNAVSWYEAAAYCNWLSAQEGIPKEQWCYEPNKEGKYAEGMTMAADYLKRRAYRLPTEAEWEYACRAGTITEYSCGDSPELLHKYAWFISNALSKSHPVGSLKSNDLGLFDMHGNVWEWCKDAYAEYPKTKEKKAVDDIEGATPFNPKTSRVSRGGSFDCQSSDMRPAVRTLADPAWLRNLSGFRVSRTLPLDSFTALPLSPKAQQNKNRNGDCRSATRKGDDQSP